MVLPAVIGVSCLFTLQEDDADNKRRYGRLVDDNRDNIGYGNV